MYQMYKWVCMYSIWVYIPLPNNIYLQKCMCYKVIFLYMQRYLLFYRCLLHPWLCYPNNEGDCRQVHDLGSAVQVNWSCSHWWLPLYCRVCISILNYYKCLLMMCYWEHFTCNISFKTGPCIFVFTC